MIKNETQLLWNKYFVEIRFKTTIPCDEITIYNIIDLWNRLCKSFCISQKSKDNEINKISEKNN